MAITVRFGFEEPPDPPGIVPIIPGGEGPGIFTSAGRGGQIIRVTNLNASGAGSLRAAVDTPGPRIIVFDVSGTIDLTNDSTDLVINDPYCTIAGQTAPSPGILIRGRLTRIETHDVLVQHIRFRVGDAAAGTSPGQRDCLRQLDSQQIYNVVMDHCSFSWSIDELVSNYNMFDVTYWRCVFSEPLHDSIHPDGPHSKCLFFAEEAGLNKAAPPGEHGVAVIGCLLCHSDDRTPAQKSNTRIIFLNNVVYNWSNSYALVCWDNDGLGPAFGSYIGNVYIEGPDTPASAAAGKFYATQLSNESRFFVSDNRYNGSVPGDPWDIFNTSELSFNIKAATKEAAIWHSSISTIKASSTVEAWVAANAGCRPTDRDAVDTRIFDELAANPTRTGGIKDSVTEAGGWPTLAQNTSPITIPENPHGDDDNDGYTNIEELLIQMATAVET